MFKKKACPLRTDPYQNSKQHLSSEIDGVTKIYQSTIVIIIIDRIGQYQITIFNSTSSFNYVTIDTLVRNVQPVSHYLSQNLNVDTIEISDVNLIAVWVAVFYDSHIVFSEQLVGFTILFHTVPSDEVVARIIRHFDHPYIATAQKN